MTMPELLTAATLLLTSTSTALRLSSSAAAALAAGEQRLQLTDRLEAELVLMERQVRDLAVLLPPAAAGGQDPLSACQARAASLGPQLTAQPLAMDLVRRVTPLPGPGALLALELRSQDGTTTRQRILSLAAMGLCGGNHATS